MRRGRLLRWTLIPTVVVLCLIGSAAIVIRTDWFHDWLRRTAIERSAPFLNGQLTIGSLTGNVLGGITLHDVVLRQEGRPVVSVATLSASYDAMGLLRGRLILDDVALSGVVLNVVQTADGWNVAKLIREQKASTGASKPFTMRRFAVVQGRVTVVPVGGPTYVVEDVAARGALFYEASQLRIPIEMFTGRDPATGVNVRSLSTTLRLAGHDFLADDLNLATDESRLSGYVRFLHPDARPALDASVNAAALSLREIGQYVPALSRHRLVLAVDARANGTFENLTVHAAAKSSAGDLTTDFVANLVAATTSATGSVAVARLNPGPVLERPDLAGHVTGATRFALTIPGGDLARAKVTYDLTAPDVTVGTYQASHVVSRGTYAPDVWRGTLRADAYGAHADVHGEWRNARGGARYTIAGNVAQVDLPRLGRTFKIPALTNPRLAGIVNAAIDVRGQGGGSLTDHAASGVAVLTNSSIGGVTLPSMRIDASLTQRQLTADLNGTFRGLHADMLGLPASVTVDANGELKGCIIIKDVSAPQGVDTIDATGAVVLAPSEAMGVKLDEGTIDATLVAGLVTVRKFDLSGISTTVHATGQLALGDRDASALDYVVDSRDLAPIGERTGQPLAGRAHVEGKITGPRSLMTITGTASGQQLAYGEVATALTLSGDFTATLPDLDTARIEGKSALHATFVTIEGTDLQRVGADLAYGPKGLDFHTTIDQPSRSLDVAGLLVLHPDHREVHLQKLALGVGGVSWGLLEGSDAAIHYGGDRITVKNLTLTREAQRISIDGSVPFEHTTTSTTGLDVRLEAVQVADVNAIFLGAQPLTGQIDGTVRMTGTAKSPDIHSDITVTKGAVDRVQFESLTAAIDYRDGRMGVDVDLAQTATSRLTAKGTVPLGGEGGSGLDLRVESTTIDVGLFQVFTDHLRQMQGTAKADLRITGTRQAPIVNGTVETSDVAFTVVTTGMPYSHVNSRVRFEGDTVHIEQLALVDNDGHTLTAEGGVSAWWGAREIDVKLTADKIHVLNNELGELSIDGSAHVGGSLANPELTGRVRARTARLEVDKWLARVTSNREEIAPDPIEPAPGSQPTPGSLFDRAKIALDLDLPDSVLLRGRGLQTAANTLSLGDVNLTVGGSLHFGKAPGAPISLVGTVTVVRGSYSFQGRRFDVAPDSEVTFRGRTPIDPDLNVKATREISGVMANVQLGGTARNPQLTLSSDPILDQGDILSLIVFDSPINELGRGQRVSLAERAATLAVSAAATPIVDSVARALDLDVFEILPNGDNGTGPTVSLGRRIGGNLFVGVQQHFGEAQGSELSIEYRFSRFLRLVTSVADSSQRSSLTRHVDRSGIDLIFLLRF